MANTKVTGDVIANGTISTVHLADNAITSDKITGITTAHITEGSNLYYTDTRVRAAISVNGNALSYDSSTGVITSNYEESPTFTGNITFGDSHFIGDDADDNLLIQSSANENIIINSVDDLLLRTSGTTKLIVKNGGNVGIGTTSPDGNLEVIASTTVSGASDSVNNVLIGLQAANRPTIILDTADTTYTNRTWNITNVGSAGSLFFGRNGLDVLVMKNDGKVGIGTTAPSEKLQVNGNIRVAGVGNSIGFDTTGALLSNGIKTINDYETVIYNDRGSAGFAVIGNSNIRLGFGTNYTNAETDLFINSSGSVGISTTSPNKKLEILSTASDHLRLAYNSSAYWDLFQNAADGSFRILKDNGSLFTFSQPGNLGIGTSSPDSKLDVTGGDITVNTTGTGFMNFKYSNSSKGTIGTDGIDLKITAAADLQLLPTGNVGIGTTSPSAKLHIHATSGDGLVRITGDNIINSGGAIKGFNNGLAFNVAPSGGGSEIEAIRIQGNGNVGISTTSPAYKFHVSNNTNGFIGRFTGGVSSDVNIGIFGNSTNNFGSIGTESNDRFSLFTNGVDRLNISNTGNVGIGTTSPTNTLHVYGNGIVSRVSGATIVALRIQRFNSSGRAQFTLEDENGAQIWRNGLTGPGSQDFTFFDGTNNAVVFQRNSHILLNPGGNVGIGESSPAEKLEVNGNIKAGDTTGKFFTNVYTATTASFADTFSNSGAGLWEYTIRINPNPGGSGAYVDFYYGKVGVGTGWNGSNVTDYIWYQEDQTAPRSLYPSGGGNKTISWVMVSGGSEVTNVSGGATVTIRVKGFGGHSYNQNVNIYLRRLA